MSKGRNNKGKGEGWRNCSKCCAFCSDSSCKDRVCVTKSDLEGIFCSWMCSPSEWLLGKIDDKARRDIYNMRRYEHWLSEGFRPNDYSWEGNKLALLQETNPEAYEEAFKNKDKYKIRFKKKSLQ